MRCLACDCNLTDFESTRKSATTGLYVDLCNRCFYTIEEDFPSLIREDLQTPDDFKHEGDLDDGF
jgi:uncharacterized protein YbaR (Trm112 family)